MVSAYFVGLVGVEQAVSGGRRVRGRPGVVVVSVRPSVSGGGLGAGGASGAAPDTTHGEGRRRWRGLDLGRVQASISRPMRRGCAARSMGWWWRGGVGASRRRPHVGSSTTRWPGWRCSTSKIGGHRLLRVAWRTVGAIVDPGRGREDRTSQDPFDGLRRIGIDEISYKRGYRYLTGGRRPRQRPAGVGRQGPDQDDLARFFDAARARAVRADQPCLRRRGGVHRLRSSPSAARTRSVAADPFHVVAWANDALDEVRRSRLEQAGPRPGWSPTRSGWARSGSRPAHRPVKALKDRPGSRCGRTRRI